MAAAEAGPTRDAEAPYWAAAAGGHVAYQVCIRCGRALAYPRDRCPGCGGASLEWRNAAGQGVVYSFSVLHRAPSPAMAGRVPYVLALVDLPEGIRRLTCIVDCPVDAVHIGMPVRAVFRPEGGQVVPFFAPDPASGGGGA